VLNIFNHKHAISLTLFWALLLVVSLLVIEKIASLSSKIIVRKYFHFLILIIIISGMMSEEFLKKVLALVFFAFFNLEFIRSVLREENSLVKKLHIYLKKYTDKRDTDNLIATHIYLLFGCSYSLWETKGFNNPKNLRFLFLPLLMKLSGVFFLGLGDSFAAIIGKKYGRTRIYLTGKSLEGTLSCFISLTIAFSCVIFMKGINYDEKLNVVSKLLLMI